MIQRNQQRKTGAQKDRGFTIIEVMIVLAIAGLIMLIVFLAVPALQRNSRNTQRRRDVAALLAAVSEYSNNNNGILPGNATLIAGSSYFCAGPGACTTTGTPAQLGYYSSGTITWGGTGTPGTPTVDNVSLYTGYVCSGSAAVAGSARSVVAIFAVEPGITAQCQAS